MKKYFIYMDEAGNTGGDLFNKEQQYFVYGYLFANIDLDQVKINSLLLSKLRNLKHAEEIRTNYKSILDLHFVIVEKKYFATCLLFDEIFDSGTNEKINDNEYFNLITRHELLIEFYKTAQKDNFQKISELYASFRSDNEGFILCFLSYIDYLRKFTKNNKMRSILNHVLKYPEKFFVNGHDIQLNPQLILYNAGFESLIETKKIKNTSLIIRHDQSSSVEPLLNTKLPLLSKELSIQQGYDNNSGMMTLTKIENNINIEYEFVEKSLGVTIVDFFSWLIYKKFNAPNKSKKLNSVLIELDKYSSYNILNIDFITAQLNLRKSRLNNKSN